jgi:hypothetical protein
MEHHSLHESSAIAVLERTSKGEELPEAVAELRQRLRKSTHPYLAAALAAEERQLLEQKNVGRLS